MVEEVLSRGSKEGHLGADGGAGGHLGAILELLSDTWGLLRALEGHLEAMLELLRAILAPSWGS